MDTAMATVTATRRAARVLAAGVGLALMAPCALADWRIVPSITLLETWSDNPALAADADARSGWVTDLAPQLHVESVGARGKLFADYAWHETRYSSHKVLDNTQRFLDAEGSLRAIEDWFLVDGRAAITQQNRSAFGAASTPNQLTFGTNRVETSLYQLAPRIRGEVPGIALYRLGFVGSRVASRDESLPVTYSGEWTGRLRNATPSARFGWAVDVHALALDNDVVGTKRDTRASASFIYNATSDLHISLLEGRESSDFGGNGTINRSTPGLGVAWTPNPRTQLTAVGERRFFGTGHTIDFSYRTARTAWRASSVRDATVLTSLVASGGAYDAVVGDLTASGIPDLEARDRAARAFLDANGIGAASAINSTFLSARPFIFRRQALSGAYLGPRDTVTLTFSTSDHRSLGPSAGSSDVFASTEDVRQRDIDLNWAHRLTPLTTLALAATTLRAESLTGPSQRSRQKIFGARLISQLNDRMSCTIGARYTRFSADIAAPFSEKAVYASLIVRL
jgi:uncharacterized protein (PEP-CTERM system associated)